MKKSSVVWLALIQLVLALEWLHASWGKWVEAGFMANIGKTLTGFAEQAVFPGYGDFLRSIAVPNAELFGNVIRSSEALVGIAFILSALILLYTKRLPVPAVWLTAAALLGGALMNFNFYLAAGAGNASTWGLNVVMGLIQLILAGYYFSNRLYLAEPASAN